MIVSGTRDNSPRKRPPPRDPDLTPSKSISAGYAAEETRKHPFKILRPQPTSDIDKILNTALNKPSHNTHNENTRGFIMPNLWKRLLCLR